MLAAAFCDDVRDADVLDFQAAACCAAQWQCSDAERNLADAERVARRSCIPTLARLASNCWPTCRPLAECRQLKTLRVTRNRWP